jgi:hypothetical protein
VRGLTPRKKRRGTGSETGIQSRANLGQIPFHFKQRFPLNVRPFPFTVQRRLSIPANRVRFASARIGIDLCVLIRAMSQTPKNRARRRARQRDKLSGQDRVVSLVFLIEGQGVGGRQKLSEKAFLGDFCLARLTRLFHLCFLLTDKNFERDRRRQRRAVLMKICLARLTRLSRLSHLNSPHSRSDGR